MTRLKDATFEGASLTGTNGATSTSGTVTLDATSLMKGTYSAKYDTAVGFSRFDVTASDDIYVSGYIYLTTVANSIRSIYITNGARLDIRSNRALRLQDSAGTQIGSDSAVLSLNTLYRFGLHWRKATIAGNDGQTEAYVTATGSPDAAFGAAFASSTTLTQTGQLTRIDVGNTSGATANTWFADNIRIDNVAMPTDDTSTNTPKNITLSVTSTLTFGPKAVAKPIALAVTSIASILKAISFIKALVITVLPSVIKAKPVLVSLVVNSAATIQKTILKPITIAVTSTINRLTAYSKIITKAITSTVTATKDIPRTITKAVSNTITIQKTILKPITQIVTGTIIFIKGFVSLKTITLAITSTISFTKGFLYDKIITYAVTSTIDFAKGFVTLKTITLVVASTKTVLKNVGKPVIRTVTSTLSRITNIPHNVLVSVTGIINIKKDFAFTKTKSITSTVSAIVGKGYFKTITLMVNISSLTLKNILKPITVVESIVVSLQPKQIGKTITTVINTVTTSIHGLANFKNITYNVSTTIVRRLNVGKLVSYIEGTVVNVQRSFTLLIAVFINAPVVLSVQKNIQMMKSIVVNTLTFFSKILANISSNTPFSKNVRSLTLGFKNSALDVFGKNIRTIDLQDTNES